MLNFDPLEQFSVELYSSFFNTLLTGSFSSIGLMSIFVLFIVLFCYYSLGSIFLLNKFKKGIISLFLFVLGILKDSVWIKKYSFILLFYSTFLFIFISNILGMIPYSMTITSHLILTLYFSLAFFIGNNLIGLCFHREKYFVLFLPEGVPVPIIPFLILIEYVSYISRIFSLAIRLFANMMSGHILLKILISFL
jgi:ATP synthase subunit 6